MERLRFGSKNYPVRLHLLIDQLVLIEVKSKVAMQVSLLSHQIGQIRFIPDLTYIVTQSVRVNEVMKVEL